MHKMLGVIQETHKPATAIFQVFIGLTRQSAREDSNARPSSSQKKNAVLKHKDQELFARVLQQVFQDPVLVFTWKLLRDTCQHI